MLNSSKISFKRKSSAVRIALFLLVALVVIEYVLAPPSPHNIEGRVFANGSINGVPEGTTVSINDTTSNTSIFTTTEDPGPPELKGIYSTVISGTDGDIIVVKAWNNTHYGINTSILLGTTTSINVVLNYSRPSETNVTIILPTNNSKFNTSFTFNITANISIFGDNANNCNATIYFSNNKANITLDQNITNQLGDIDSGSYRTTTWNISGLRQGLINVTAQSQCSTDGINLEGYNSYKIHLQINDTTSPIVNLNLPQNSSWTTQNLTFSYNVTEFTGIKNCSLYIDGRFNQSSLGIETESANNFTLNNTPDGQHTYLVSCTDNSTNFNTGNSSFRIFNVDGFFPNITLLFPSNGSTLESYRTIFRYNATDNLNVSNCSLIINGIAMATNNTVVQNISNNFTVSLSGGDYNWSVNCSDNSNSIFASGFFSIFTPDFYINESLMLFSKQFFVEKEIIEINATFFNRGSGNSTKNVSIVLYDNFNLASQSVLKNESFNITSGSNATISYNYTTSTGTHVISAVADSDLDFNGTIIESNETNNLANRTIFITAYNIYYGDVKSDILLDSTSNITIFSWINLSNFRGTIFASDSDSSIGFNFLIALGRNISHNITMNDFEELDLALNTTNFTDSINRTFTLDGVVRTLDNFTIFQSLIEDAPIINSTNTSSFVTGILWDSSDPSSGQYSGTQDVVFITKVSKNSLGSFGTYDYEIKIPSNLKRYITPNTDDTLTFYREIT